MMNTDNLGIIDPDEDLRNHVEAAIQERAEEDEREERRRKIEAFTQHLDGVLHDSVRAKSSVEARWIDDVRQLNGLARMASFSKGDIDAGRHNERPPVSQVTRSKQMLWEAKLARMLSNDEAWDLDVSQMPTLRPQDLAILMDAILAETPEGQEPREPTHEEMREAARPSMEKMKSKIKDDLQESNIKRVHRRTFRDATRIGAGLEMGPIQRCKYRRVLHFIGGQVQLENVKYTVPKIEEGDPRFFYPEPAPNITKCTYSHYIHLQSEAELTENIENGYDPESVAGMIKAGPDHSVVGDSFEAWNLNSGETEAYKNRFAVRRYVGVLTKEQKELLGLNDEQETELLFSEGTKAPQLVCEIYYAQGFVLSAQILPCLGEFRLPYYVYTPFPADDSMWGMSIAFMCREAVRIVDAGLQIGLHNASGAAGPQTFMKKGHFKPLDGNRAIRGPKQWDWLDPDATADISKSLYMFQPKSNAAEAFEIYERGLSMVDMDLNSPNLLGDDPVMASKLQPTTLAMFLSVMTYLQQTAAEQYDEDITKPEIQALYMWNLIYTPDDEIKGSFDPVARGASHLVVKDIQAQHVQLLSNYVAQNPEAAAYVDQYELLKTVYELLDLPTRKILLSKEEGDAIREQQAQGQADPMLEVHKMRAETEKMKAQNDADDKTRDDQFRSQKFMMEMDANERSEQMQFTTKLMERDIAMARLAVEEKVSMEEVAAKLNMHDTSKAIEQTLAVMNARMKGAEIASRDREMALKQSESNLDPQKEGI